MTEEAWLGAFKTENQAWKNIAIGKNKRDRGEFEPLAITPYNPDEEHFQILVVSEHFRHKTTYERVAMVYNAILDLLWHPTDISHLSGKTSRWKNMVQ